MVLEMTGSVKRRTLIFLGLVLIITVIVAAGLPRLELKPGMPLPEFEQGQLIATPIEAGPSVTLPVSEFVETLLGLILAGAALYLIYLWTRGIGWKNLAAHLQPIMIGISIASVLLYLIAMLLYGPQDSAQAQLPAPMATPPLDTSPLGPVPALLFWIIAAGLLVISSLVGIWIFRSSARRPGTVEAVGLEAEKAWQAILAGQDLKAVILQCYRQMSLALEQERGIEREEWMTTREFETLLEAAGIPHTPIDQLTQLFEAVRYGDWQPNPADEQKAIQCLQTIRLHSRETRNLD